MNDNANQSRFHERHPLHLDANKVPKAFHHLIPLAERWGIHYVEELDDFEIRRILLNEASNSEINEMMGQLAPHMVETPDPADDLYTWLAGPEADLLEFSTEYLAFTFMSMVFDSVYSSRNKRKT